MEQVLQSIDRHFEKRDVLGLLRLQQKISRFMNQVASGVQLETHRVF